MRTRVAGSVLVLGLLGVALTACGGSSSSSNTTTTSTTSASTSTSSAVAGAPSGPCAQAEQLAVQLGQRIQAAATANPPNTQAIVQAVQSFVPQIQTLANRASGSTKTALNNLYRSLQTVANGSTGSSAATAISNAANQVAAACT